MGEIVEPAGDLGMTERIGASNGSVIRYRNSAMPATS